MNSILSVSITALLLASPLLAQESATTIDPLFPESGRFTATFVTGIPFAGLLEFSYGISDRAAIGVVGGYAWKNIPAMGVRPRMVLAGSEDGTRLVARMPILYYPETAEDEAWGLVWPQLELQWPAGDVRLMAGAGIVGSACIDALFSTGAHASDAGHHHEHVHHEGMIMTDLENEVMGGICPSVQSGVAMPVSDQVTLHAEGYLILKDIRIANEGWISDVPYVIALGVTYGF